jgi:Protein of unknown function (DUF2877)
MTASILCAPLLDGLRQPLYVVHRSRSAYQLADRHGTVRLCVADPAAIRLPHALTVRRLPAPTGTISIGGGRLDWGSSAYSVARWWLPPRPALPALRGSWSERAAADLRRRWRGWLGRGDGLTPYGDDVICGALVALHAAGEPAAAQVSQEVAATALELRTTATSAALLRLAAAGWCIPAVADYLRALASGHALSATRAALLGVGSSSGRGLLEGIGMIGVGERTAVA